MALYLKKVSETYKSKVYTEDGYFLGEVEDVIIVGNKIYGWKIKVMDPDLNRRGIRGIIVQHQLVKAMGQIWIVSKAVYSVKEKGEQLGQSEKEATVKEGEEPKIDVEKVE